AKLKGAILYAGKEKIGMVYILSDITEIVNLNTELENKVVSRTKLLSEAKDEAEDRLRITEIYTRRSIVEMIKNGIDPTRITPTNKNVTVLFSDIRNFTALSERMNALTTIGLLNQYFEKMNKIVIDHDGEIDKLIGDCIMALFDEPENAISCAIAMRKGLSELNDENHLPFRLDSGIGINYGEVSVGNIGSGSKMDLTVIGDIVNSASRLESLTKHYYLPIIISEDVAAQMKGEHDTRFVDHVLVKGKTDPIRIYEVYDQDKNDIKELKKEKAPQMAEAYNEYIVGNFSRAIQLYQTIYKSLPPHTWRTGESADPLVDFYLQRILSLNEKKELGLMKSWNGIYEFSEK
ncbi:MAG TPA: adenylate/guanylate cyclase domain-containing protein, partial [Treponemataceae bacterium]|nr:adenylate/guanylate cyclase domain-containing protein [Treponemataceae bacterium]